MVKVYYVLIKKSFCFMVIIMKKVSIDPGCTTCGVCEFIAPEIFEVIDISHIKKEADFNAHKDAIKEAVRLCPVSVINVEE